MNLPTILEKLSRNLEETATVLVVKSMYWACAHSRGLVVLGG